jgi:hypothetical protein
MTDALIPYEQPPARVIPSSIGPVIPVVDIAENLGYTRSSITNTITKNKELFEGFISNEALPTIGGTQVFLCMNGTGIERLILLLRPMKNRAELCQRVESFRAKAFGKLAEQKTVQQPVNPEAALKASLSTARLLATETGGDLAAFQKIALEKCGLGEWAPALSTVSTIVHGEPGWHNATQLGEMAGLTAEQVNAYLYNKGFQYREGKIWRLNPTGEMHGKEYVFEATSGHREVRIRWRESILYASGLKRPIDESQLVLPVRA